MKVITRSGIGIRFGDLIEVQVAIAKGTRIDVQLRWDVLCIFVHFYPRGASDARVIAIIVCLCVCL